MGETLNQPRKLNTFKRLRRKGAETDDVFYHLHYGGVPDELEKYAETELRETAENVAKGMKGLKKYLRDKNLTDVEDHTLRLVLRNCKYDLKKSAAKLDKFLKVYDRLLEKVIELDEEKVECILKDGIFAVLPYRDKFGRAIFYTQPRDGSGLYDLDDFFFCICAVLMNLMTFPMFSLTGLVYVGDCKTPSISLLYRNVMILKNYIWMLFSLPVRVQKVYIINENFLARWFYRIARPIVPSKIYQRISFHGANLEILQDICHPDVLPEECGGNMGPIDMDFYREELIHFIRKLKAERRRKDADKCG